MSTFAITALLILVTGLTSGFVGGLALWTKLAEAGRQERLLTNARHPLDRAGYLLDPFGIVLGFAAMIYLMALLRYWTRKEHVQETLAFVAGIGMLIFGGVLLLVS